MPALFLSDFKVLLQKTCEFKVSRIFLCSKSKFNVWKSEKNHKTIKQQYFYVNNSKNPIWKSYKKLLIASVPEFSVRITWVCWTDFFEPILPSIGKVNTVSYKMKFWLMNGEGCFCFGFGLFFEFHSSCMEGEGFFFFLMKVHNLVWWLRMLAELFPTCVSLASDLSSLGLFFLIYKMDVLKTVPRT